MKHILFKSLFASFTILLATSSASAMTCTNLTKSLARGQENGEVLMLQQFLADGGYLTVKPNGFFGNGTVNAVKKFQIANGMSPVGTVGPATRGKVKEVSCKNNANTSQTLSKSNTCIELKEDLSFFSSTRSTSTEVLLLQQFLHERNYLISKPTGVFDAATTFAVKDFKKRYSLSSNDTMDSDVDSITRAKIKELSCSGIKESTVNSLGDFYKQCAAKVTVETATLVIADSKFASTTSFGEEIPGLIEVQKNAKITQTGKLDQSTKEAVCSLAVVAGLKGLTAEVKKQNTPATSSVSYNKNMVIESVDLMNLPVITITGSGLLSATGYRIESTLENGYGSFSFGRMINSKDGTANKIIITLSEKDSNFIVNGLKKFTTNKAFYLTNSKGSPSEPFVITNYKGAN